MNKIFMHIPALFKCCCAHAFSIVTKVRQLITPPSYCILKDHSTWTLIHALMLSTFFTCSMSPHFAYMLMNYYHKTPNSQIPFWISKILEEPPMTNPHEKENWSHQTLNLYTRIVENCKLEEVYEPIRLEALGWIRLRV